MAYDYIQAFTDGHAYNRRVAEYLRTREIKCHAPELQIAKNTAERRHLTLTEQDIVLEGLTHILEVKSSSREFTDDPNDFPYDDTIVDTVSSFEDKLHKPCAYILVSKVTGAMVAIGVSSQPRWKKRTFFDHKQQLTDDFYLANKEDIRHMDDLVEYLLKLQRQA